MRILVLWSKCTSLNSFRFLQKLRVANVDRPIADKSVCGLDTLPPFKQRWELLDFIPGAHVLGNKQMTVNEMRIQSRISPRLFFSTRVMLKSSWTDNFGQRPVWND